MLSMQIKAHDASSMLIIPKKSTLMAAKRNPLALHTAKPNTITPGSNSNSLGWNFMNLGPVPPIYAVERTHVYVQDTAANIARRITECLRLHSMAAVYSPSEVSVDVETQENVQLTVRIWEAGKNKEPGHILVEAQKILGCGYGFCQAAKAILRAAKGMVAPTASNATPLAQQSQRSMAPLPPAAVPITPSRRTIPSIPKEEAEVEDVRDGLMIAAELLSQNQHDSRLLALESLEQLSRAAEHRHFVARFILSGQGGFRKAILGLIQSGSPKLEEENDPSLKVEYDFQVLMRRYALIVLANCLTNLEQSGELVSAMTQNSQTFQHLTCRDVLMALVGDLAAAQVRPHEACHAAECLRALLLVATNTSSTTNAADYNSSAYQPRQALAEDLGVVELLSHAHRIGQYGHVALEGACSKFLAILS